MRVLIVLEETEAGFAVQVPDLAIMTCGESVEAAKDAARQAIRVNLEAYREAGQEVPGRRSTLSHMENPDLQDLLFAYVELSWPRASKSACLP